MRFAMQLIAQLPIRIPLAADAQIQTAHIAVAVPSVLAVAQ
jgi:hypothetical protein